MTQNNGQTPEQDPTVVRRVSEIGRIPVSETRAAKAVEEAKKIVANALAQAQDGPQAKTVLAQQSPMAADSFPTHRDDSPDLARSDEGPSLKTTGERHMTYKPLFATLAALLLGGVFLFSQHSGNQAFALEKVIASFRNATTGRYDWTEKRGTEERTQTVTFAPGKVRWAHGGKVQIDHWEVGKGLRIDNDARRAESTFFGGAGTMDLPPDEQAKVRDMYRKQANPIDGMLELLEDARKDSTAKIESLGEKIVGGHAVEGHKIAGDRSTKTFWTLKGSGQPVSIEIEPFGRADKLTISNCEFNIDIDESQFSLRPPAGYDFTEGSKIPQSETEADFISALKLVCKSRSGEFPDAISGQGLEDTVQAFFATKDTPENSFAVQQGLKFPNHVSNVYYAGSGAKSGQSNRPILWYQLDNGYRVIFADFSTKNVAEVPQHDDALRIK